MRRPVEVLVALGSNVAPERWIPWAQARLATRFGNVRHASAWSSPSLGGDGRPDGRPDFVNTASVGCTDLDGRALRTYLRDLEWQAGRRRSADRHAARSLDLDLLATRRAGTLTWLPGTAELPLHELVPAAELWPEQPGPGGGATLQARLEVRRQQVLQLLVPWRPTSG